MQEEKTFQQVLQGLQRPINCLVDEDRNTRKSGLTTISNQLTTVSKSIQIKLFTSTNLAKFLNRVLEDKIQANRQLALNICDKFANDLPGDINVKDYLQALSKALIARINNTPFPETSEELRLKIVQFLKKLTIYSHCLIPHITDLSNAISKCLIDPYPQLKKNTCNLIQDLCKHLKFHIGHHSTVIVKSLAINLTHQHSKVRKQILSTLASLLVTQSAGVNFEIVQVSLKASLSDKIVEVRRAALECIAKLLNLFGPKYLKLHEAKLVSYLLSGFSDQSQENVQRAMVLLQECGGKRKELEDQLQGNNCQEKIIQQSIVTE